jgi:hypothetical protein
MRHVQVRLEDGEHDALQERAGRDFEGNLQAAAKEAIVRFLADDRPGNKRLHGLLDTVLGYEGEAFVGPMLERLSAAARAPKRKKAG